MTTGLPKVRAARCRHDAPDEQVAATLRRLTEPLEASWERLLAARTIGLKINWVWWPDRLRDHAGRRQEHVDPAIIRAVLELLRERCPQARLVVVDTSLDHELRDIFFLDFLADYGVEFVNCNDAPFQWRDVPEGGILFERYQLHPILSEIDELVSVAKMKNHAFMGVTLSTKNLFGLPPIHPTNRHRQYFHHIIRLPYVLAELGRLLDPALNIVDGLVGQAGREWGGEARIPDTLLAGEQCFATDLCGAWLMGHDPWGDWPEPPFRRDRNHLQVAAERGWAPTDFAGLDFEHDLTRPVAEFDSDATDPRERVASWRRSMCEQALYYRDHWAEFEVYAGEYILLQNGRVLWHGDQAPRGVSRRELAGADKGAAIWTKYVDPAETEGERLDIYERELEALTELV